LPTLGKSKHTGSKAPFQKQISLTYTFTWVATTVGVKPFSEKGDTYTCSHCKDNKAIAIPRVTFTFTAVDTTGTMKYTIFTKQVETLFGLTSSEFHSLATSDDASKLDEKFNHIRDIEVFIEVGPSVALNSSRLLSWVIHNISLE
ncbi:hypothetical protein RDABS01_018242, partial [Bienertia sinuspersici]